MGFSGVNKGITHLPFVRVDNSLFPLALRFRIPICFSHSHSPIAAPPLFYSILVLYSWLPIR